ncbi:flagellar assembly protein FliW [Bacillaceae bacterium S4-13-56]
MKIETKYLGEIEVSEEQVITFPHGIPGFHEFKKFVLLEIPETPPFMVLQSVEESYVAFVVVNPYVFRKDYEFNLNESAQELLEVDSETDLKIFSILSLKDPFASSTINLQAPIIINAKKKIGKQYITNSKSFSTKEPITSSAVKEG